MLFLWVAAVGTSCFSPTFSEEATLAVLAKSELTFLHAVSTSRIRLPTDMMTFFPNPVSNGGGFLGALVEGVPRLYYLKGSILRGPLEGGDTKVEAIPGMESIMGFVMGNYSATPTFLCYFPSWSNRLETQEPDLLWFTYTMANSTLSGPSVTKKVLSQLVRPYIVATIDPSVQLDDLLLRGLQIRDTPNANEVIVDTLALQISNQRIYEIAFVLDTAGATVSTVNLVSSRTNGASLYIQNPEAYQTLKPSMVRYFYSAYTNKSYAQVYTGKGYRTYTWVADSFKEIPLGKKIVALLSMGELLCVEGGYGSLRDDEGGERFIFGLGSLSFSYKLALNNVPTLLFVEAVDQRDSGGQLFYQTYTLPVSDVDKLKK